MEAPDPKASPLWLKLAWFVGLWVAGVLTVAGFAWLLKLVTPI